MTSEPVRDPVTDHLLTPQNSALVVIDYQPSQLQAMTSMDRELLGRQHRVGRAARPDLRPPCRPVDRQRRERTRTHAPRAQGRAPRRARNRPHAP